MKSSFLTKAALLAGAVSIAVGSLPSVAAAQPYDQGGPPPGYNDQGGPPPPGYQNGPPPGYQGGPPPNQGPNGGYYDAQPSDQGGPPPPPGYDGGPPSAQQRQQDEQYANYAEAWARDNCVKSGGNVAAGAIFGGTFGAILGGIAGGPRGVAVGAGLGGLGGAAVAASEQGATSPGCPPGYVVRRDAPPFQYAVGPDYYYYAPADYDPWIWYGGAWVYRPYPYHAWYYRHYGHGDYDHRGYDHRGYDHRGGYDHRDDH
jgi:hypothetical protein